MAKTDYEQIMGPMLKAAESGEISLSDAEKEIGKKLQLTQKQRNQLKKSGSERLLRIQMGWSRMYLKHAGLVTYSKPGHYKLTKSGQKLVEKNLDSIDTKFLIENYKKFRDYQDQVNQIKKLARQKRKAKTIPQQKGIVIFLDALGTKGIWNQRKRKNKDN